MPPERARARDLVGQFQRTARRQSAETPELPAADHDQADSEPAEITTPGGPRFTRMYISWESADRLDATHRTLRRHSQGRISKLQLADALSAVALSHPDEVHAELRRRGLQPGGEGTSPERTEPA